MTQKRIFLLLLIGLFLFSGDYLLAQNPKLAQGSTVEKEPKNDRLAILWTSGDPDVAKKMVFIYTYNAKKNNWFKRITFIVWGASTLLLSKDKELQDWIGKLKSVGVELYACKWCSDSYGVSDLLAQLGIKVIYYGKGLTKLIKDDWKILTF